MNVCWMTVKSVSVGRGVSRVEHGFGEKRDSADNDGNRELIPVEILQYF